jgi:hypothetical protein
MSYGTQYVGRPTGPSIGGLGGGGDGRSFAGASARPNIALGTRTLNAGLEQAVRPFESPRILALRARRQALEESDDDSEIIWGRPSEYGSANQTNEEDRRGFRLLDPKPTEKPNDQKRQRVYTEVNRTTETVRVTNPTDSSQYVDVQRIKSIVFRGPDGGDVRFDLKPPAAA